MRGSDTLAKSRAYGLINWPQIMRPAGETWEALVELAAGRRPVAVGDPEALVGSAIEHRLGGLLVTSIEAGHLELPPAETKILSMVDLSQQRHHQRLWAALESITARMNELGVEPLSLKGVTTEARWYGRMGERPCADLDLHVRPDQAELLMPLLDEVMDPQTAPALVLQLVAARQLQHADFEWEGVWIDLHFDPYKLGVWLRRPDLLETGATNFRGHRVLSPESALVNTLTHLNKDRFARLGGFADVARIMRDPALDHSRLDDLMSAEGLVIPVRKSLAAVTETLRLDDIYGRDPGGMRSLAWDLLWPSRSWARGEQARFEHRRRQAALPALMKGRGLETIAEWRRQFMPPRALMSVHQKRPMSWRRYATEMTAGRVTRAARRRWAALHR